MMMDFVGRMMIDSCVHVSLDRDLAMADTGKWTHRVVRRPPVLSRAAGGVFERFILHAQARGGQVDAVITSSKTKKPRSCDRS